MVKSYYTSCVSLYYLNYDDDFVLTDECCYIYGSIANDRNNCVPEGRQFNLNFIIYNPHDNFTNLTVRWFRNTTATVNMLTDDEISTTWWDESTSNIIDQSIHNCSFDLYRDSITLSIVNFTRNLSGYYWCQLVINDTYHAQPSPGDWFYADVLNSTHCNGFQQYFKFATSNETQCAQFINATKMSPNPTQTNTSLTVSSMDISSVSCSYPLSQTCSSSPSDRKMILYIAGGTGALLLICGVLIAISLSLCLCKVQKKKSKYI